MHQAPLGGPDREWLLAEAHRLLDGGRVTAVDGGFGWLTADGTVDPDQGCPLWITTRMTHCYALGALLGRDGDLDLVDHGVRALLADSPAGYVDAEHGGWLARPGERSTKSAYAHAFVVLAGASAVAAGHPDGARLLERALEVSEQRFWDDGAGAVVEDWDADWSTCEPYRGANANMHTVEVYLAAADATGEAVWRDRALRICERLVDTAARAHSWRVPEHFDATWTELPDYNLDAPAHPFRPYGVTPGHGLEWSRLLLHLEAALERRGGSAPAWLREAALGLYDRALTDGWDREHGGICYTTDASGVPVVTQHFHWVICEGLATAALLGRLTGEERYGADYRRMWDYARAHYLDPARPGWQHEVDPDGTPSAVTWHGRPDIYHALQACLIPLLPLAPTFASALRDGALAG